MLYIVNNSIDPYFNLALEEYFLKHHCLAEDLLILWQNCPTVVIGKNQDVLTEINYKFVSQNNINIVRRLSGGGAVYHDLGNLNFTYIVNNTKGKFIRNDFSHFAEPIIVALSKLGLPAEFTGRNDILIAGKKFSGNSQYFFQNKLLHHGTLLFNTDLSVLAAALNAPEPKHENRSVKSTKSRVTNIYDCLADKITINDFKQLLLTSIFNFYNKPYQEYLLSSEDIAKITELVTTKYNTRQWNFGRTPTYDFKQTKTFSGGTISLYLTIVNGIIRFCTIRGDFFENADVTELEAIIVGLPYNPAELSTRLKALDISQYIHNISTTEFYSCFF